MLVLKVRIHQAVGMIHISVTSPADNTGQFPSHFNCINTVECQFLLGLLNRKSIFTSTNLGFESDMECDVQMNFEMHESEFLLKCGSNVDRNFA